MKKFFILLRVLIIALIVATIIGVVMSMTGQDADDLEEPFVDKTTVEYNGRLRTDGNKIINQHGEETQLIGISSHGLQWMGELYNKDSIAALKDEFGINVFRIVIYVDPNDSGYIANPAIKEKVFELIDACIELDIYAIVDWHVLNEKNPQIYQANAEEFFAEVSSKYANKPNVIYEICNEPNGNEVTWEDNIRPYAVDIISIIRKHTDALVIVGTPDWSKDLDSAARKPLKGKNIAYAMHFYAGSHNVIYRDNIDEFRKEGLPVFISECGATDSAGDGKLYDEAFMNWVDYMHRNKISWVYWSYANKDEASAILEKEVIPDFSDEKFSLSEHLSESGKLAKKAMQKYNKKQEKNNAETNH